MYFGNTHNPNRFDYLKNSQGTGLNAPAMAIALVMFYFIFLWVVFVPAKIVGIPVETATWIARGVAAFFTIWAALGNLRGRLYLGVVIFPAVAYCIYFITNTLAR